MSIRLLKFDPSRVIEWANGTSTEIMIYPPSANYQKGDFLFRISLASVESEESVFTPLPNITRTLMLLKGKHTLIHKGYHTRSLLPFDQDVFQGDWHTMAKGKATNFNLMCKTGAVGSLEHVYGHKGTTMAYDFHADIELIYLCRGKASYNNNELESGDCLVVENKSNHHLSIACLEDCDFVRTSIKLVR